MPSLRWVLAVVLATVGLYGGAPAASQAQQGASASATAATTPAYTPKGADTCMRCHDDPAVTAIFKSKHAVRADSRTPFAQLQCESCHGPGGDHAKHLHPGQPRQPIGMFSKGSTASVAQQNAVCLTCHADNARVGWHGSVHERDGLACVSCHRIHSQHDAVTEASEQPQVCYRCHAEVRADFDKFSAHPVRDGELTCTSCHAPHDSLYPALLTKPTLNQTCYTCHAQTRGPFLWEHAPAAEDCSNCHRPHGSVNPALLTVRPPLLCQQCHSAAGHPSIAFTAEGLPGRNPSAFLLGGSCLNCHSHVHGSNAPSGADLSR